MQSPTFDHDAMHDRPHDRQEHVSLRNLLEHLRHHGEAPTFVQHNLVSDGSVPADNTDPNLVNPWGVAASPTGPFWISDNGTGVTTIYNGSGTPVPAAGHLVITIAAPPGQTTPSTPTGQVFNTAGSGFNVSEAGHSASSAFLFATEDGTISGWSPTVDAGSSIIAVDNSAEGAVYKGITMLQTSSGPLLFAANFNSGQVEAYDSSFNLVNSFTDPFLPDGYAPFNVQTLNNNLYVTFAQQDADKHDDVAGKGHGFVDEFDAQGHLINRIGSGGPLDSPWGLAIAPASFGKIAGDLLVGNFGNGTISIYDPNHDKFLGNLLGADGKPLVIGDLWALTPGNGGSAGDPNTLYFTAGVKDEAHGVFGSLTPSTPSPHMSMMDDHGMHG
jgi:uncharacterized protein (TIGR03118 family)